MKTLAENYQLHGKEIFKKADRHSDIEEIPRLLCTSNILYRIHKTNIGP